jgi:hypothetical protein
MVISRRTFSAALVACAAAPLTFTRGFAAMATPTNARTGCGRGLRGIGEAISDAAGLRGHHFRRR